MSGSGIRPLLTRRAEHALAAGAVEPIVTESAVVPDGGIPFLVRVVSSLERKAAARGRPGAAGSNPFLPYDPDLFVTDLSSTHLCLLNRFKVVEHHLLVITREFEEQDSPLNLRDFEALWLLLAEIDGVGFYNSGPEAGASQRHKHLQLVPAPLGEGPGRTSMDPVLAAARFEGEVGRAALPFAHALGRLEPDLHRRPSAAARESVALSRSLAATAFAGAPPGPFNLLLTREWMLLVPRRRGAYQGIEVNALGFAGSLLLRRPEQLDGLRRLGPLALLREVGRERAE